MALGDSFTYTPGFSPTSKAKRDPGKPDRKPSAPQQGTLFRAHKSQRKPESRQPRGYSQDRYQDVGRVTGLLKPATNPHYGPVDANKTRVTGYKNERSEYAQTLSTLARSTIPLEHFEDNTPHFYAHSDLGAGTMGEYQWGDPGRVPPRLHVATGHSKDPTAIHEMGHHNLHMSGWDPGEDMTPEARGHDEGSADRYALEHYRNPGYKRSPMSEKQRLQETGQPWNWFNAYGYTSGTIGTRKRNAFTQYYNNAYLNGEQFDQDLLRDPGLPKNHVPGQRPLIHKENPPWGSGLPVKWSINPEAMP